MPLSRVCLVPLAAAALLLSLTAEAFAVGEGEPDLTGARGAEGRAGAISRYLDDELSREYLDERLASRALPPAEELELRKLRGALLLDSGDCDRAATDLEAAVRVKPSDDEALGKRGLAYLCQGDREAARRDFAAALAAHPDSYWGLYGRGWMQFRDGNPS